MIPGSRTRFALAAAALVAVGGLAAAVLAAGPSRPRELGRVEWGRDLDAALSRGRAESRPVFLLFQEVPGCQTCVSFGEQVLSHPLLVEAIETEFVPVFVYNNRPGRDAAVRKRFGEPAWNNPVVRLLDSAGADLLRRRDGVWTPWAMGRRMIAALEQAGRPVPDYLREAVDEERPRTVGYVAFGMHCFWSGEACLGDIDAVLSSRAGFLGGGEAVEIAYDADAVSLAEMAREAQRRGCARSVFVKRDRELARVGPDFAGSARLYGGSFREAPARDQKHALPAALRALELTPRQAVRVHAAVGAGRDPSRVLSPRQRAALR